MNIDILIQARLGSNRFPRKVLAEVMGVPLIRWKKLRKYGVWCVRFVSVCVSVTSAPPPTASRS